jgi:diguanylate cyclase (GGDEF)-like protein/PAS domain S-box-containing protein
MLRHNPAPRPTDGPGPDPALPSPEALYRMLVEQVPAITYVADFAGERPFLYVSPQAEELLGYPAAEWVADPDLWERILHDDDRDRVMLEEQRTLEAVEPFEAEYRLVGRDGRLVWIWERDRIIRNDDGKPVYTQGVMFDVTELKRTQEALAESERRVRDERDRAQGYLDIAGTMIVVLGADQRVSLANRRACEVLGWSEEDLLGRNWFDTAVSETERESVRDVFGRLIAGDMAGIENYENNIVTRSGAERLVAWHNTVLTGDDGRITGTLSSGEDITDRRRAEKRVAHLAFHDQLTGLPNRAMLADRLALAVDRARRGGGSAGLLCLDLDDFKLVNDSLGHVVADELVAAVARRLEVATRHADVLTRGGGDEFFLLLPDLPREAERHGLATARRVVAAFQEPFEAAGAEFHVSASVGIALYPRDAGDADELLRHADTAMYQAKRSARGSFTLYVPEDRDPLERLSLTTRLRRALDERQLVLHYQPIFSIPDRRPVGAEALIRWRDPDRGLVAPGEFIPAAEHSGLIEPIGEWVVLEACSQAAEWQKLGLTPRLSVNASARELRRPEYADAVARALEVYGVDASRFVVEVTESTTMEDPGAGRALGRLHDLGVGVAIDDFGEGFSSLSRLRNMPVQHLKLDRSFMHDVPDGDAAAALFGAIVQLAEALGREMVAEGVETEEQLRFLTSLACPLAQGFHLARPMPADELTALLLRSD